MDYLLYILLFALATVIIFSWGIIKEQNKSTDLMNQLYKKSESKIFKAFRNKDVLTKKDIENELKNIKASLFYSRDKMIIQNPSQFTKTIINNMLNSNKIEKVPKGYILKNKINYKSN